MASRRIRIGCAGWSIPSAHSGDFGAGASQLERYATRFDLVEINSSFYRPHRESTYRRWAASVPRDFRFAVKAPRSITHEHRLHDAGDLLDRFCGEAAGLGAKFGVLLVQLPPSLAFDARVAATFFAMLRRRLDVPVACEPRHRSWFMPLVDALLERHHITRVAADPVRCEGAGSPAGDTSKRYWRWHGSPRIYYSAYTPARLSRLADALRIPALGPDWIIFDNTAQGHAIPDALRLRSILDGDRADA